MNKCPLRIRSSLAIISVALKCKYCHLFFFCFLSFISYLFAETQLYIDQSVSNNDLSPCESWHPAVFAKVLFSIDLLFQCAMPLWSGKFPRLQPSTTIAILFHCQLANVIVFKVYVLIFGVFVMSHYMKNKVVTCSFNKNSDTLILTNRLKDFKNVIPVYSCVFSIHLIEPGTKMF